MRVRNIEGLGSPNSPYHIILLYGTDRGQIDGLVATLTRAVAGDDRDPFQVATLDHDDPSFPLEVVAASLTGGRRVVRLQNCNDRSVDVLSAAKSANADCLVIAVSGALTKRSKLLQWAENERGVACFLCEPENLDRRAADIRAVLATFGQHISDKSMTLLIGRLPDDMMEARASAAKLGLYAGAATAISDDHVDAVLGESVDGAVMTVVDATMVGDGTKAMLAFQGAIAGGAGGVGVIRVLGGDLLRLSRALHALSDGQSSTAALQRARVFGSDARRHVFERALRLWQMQPLDRAVAAARATELRCKQSGADDALLTSRALGVIARLAREGA